MQNILPCIVCFSFSQPLLPTPTHSTTPRVSSVPGQCRVSPIPALLSFQNRPRQALSICEYSKRRGVPCGNLRNLLQGRGKKRLKQQEQVCSQRCLTIAGAPTDHLLGYNWFRTRWQAHIWTHIFCIVLYYCNTYLLLEHLNSIYRYHRACTMCSKFKSVYKWLQTIAGAHCVLP